MSAYVAWAHDPHLSAVASGRTGGPWWMAYAKNWMARRRPRPESVYLRSSIESTSCRKLAAADSSRVLVDDLTPVRLLEAREASLVLNELTNRPGTFWDGATGSGITVSGDRGNRIRDGEHGGSGGIRPAGAMPWSSWKRMESPVATWP